MFLTYKNPILLNIKNKTSRSFLNSRHLTGHAIDIAAWVNGVRWDWPLYEELSKTFKRVATQLDIPIVWGGDWVSFRDGPHYELDRRML